MSITANDLYQVLAYDMLEDPPNGLVLGLLTLPQFIDLLNSSLSDFLKEACLVERVWTFSINAGVGTYPVPDNFIRVDNVFLAGRYLSKASVQELNGSMRGWRRNSGPPKFWYEDGLPPKTIGLAPAPNFNSAYILGAHEPGPPHGIWDSFSAVARPLYSGSSSLMTPNQHRGLTLIGPCSYSETDNYGDYYLPVVGLSDNVPAISPSAPAGTVSMLPDDFVRPYLLWDVLERVFASDSECKDNQKAAFSAAQYKEGIALAKQVTGEEGAD